MSAAEVPIRQIDDIEIPVSGMWPAVGASRVVRSTGSRSARAVPVVSGWLEVGDDPATNALCIELDDSILLATTARVSHNGHGWSEWHLEGVACTVDRRDPLALTLRYHGVYQRGGDALAWWSGEGTIAAPDDRRGRRGRRRLAADGERFGVQLLLAAPGRSGVSLTNVVAYMQHRMVATAIANEARHGADPTFGMLQRIVRAARADIDAATAVLSARPGAPLRVAQTVQGSGPT